MPYPPHLPNKVVTSYLAVDFGININSQQEQMPMIRIARLPRATLDLAETLVNEFRAACGGSAQTLFDFLEFLNAGQAPAKLQALRHINATFMCNLTTFPAPQAVPLARWLALGATCVNVPVGYRPFLSQFFQPRDENTLRRIEAIHHAAGANAIQAIEIMKIVAERRGVAVGVSRASIGDLVRMLQAHRPMSGFDGFVEWGPGDNGNPADNLEAHVLKHVCREPADPDFGIYEAVKWWDLLRIRVTLADYDRIVGGNPVSVAASEMARTCFDGDAPLRGDHLRRFLICHGLQNHPGLTQFVKNQALLPYRDFAIQSSRVMTDVVVQSDGGDVFISGAAGDAFIIGRFEGNQLGISSCYFPLDINEKLAGATAKLCWRLRQPARSEA